MSVAQDVSRSITLDQSNAPLINILDSLKAQTELDYAYSPQAIDVQQPVTFQCTGVSLEHALELMTDELFISFQLVENQLVVAPLDRKDLPLYMLTGNITDSLSGESLIYATVSVNGTNHGVTTNEYGYFALPLRRGTHDIVISYVGFNPVEQKVHMLEHQSMSFALNSLASNLPTVVVSRDQNAENQTTDLSHVALTQDDLKRLPEFVGESGLIKNLENIPGVKLHSEVSSFFFVRGGDRDQNIIILDDAPIYNPSHLLGFSSIVLPEFVSNIDVFKGDMPANLGDRLSSIVSVRTRDGNLNKFQLSAALNPFVNRVTVEIPVIKQRSSIFASYRRSLLEPLYKQAAPQTDYFFQDLHIKWNYRSNEKNRFFITVLASNDNYTSTTGQIRNLTWGNFAATFRWNRVLGPKLFSNTTLYTGNYSYTLALPPNRWKSELGNLSLKSDFTHYIDEKITSKFGVEAQGYFNNPGRFSLDSSNAILPNVTRNYGRKLVAHYQSSIDISPKIQFNAGFRLINWDNLGPMTYYTYDENREISEPINAPEGVYNSYFNIDPRLSLSFFPSQQSAIKMSYGIYHQYLQLISNSISPFTAMEIYLTSSPTIKPQASEQWTFDFSKYWPQKAMRLNLSTYYKTSKNQIDLAGHSTIYLNEFLEGELFFGTSEAYGVEFQMDKTLGNLNASLAYTWSRAWRETSGINNDQRYRAFQDRPHDVSLTLGYQFSNRLNAQAYWTSYSGSPFTSPVGFYEFQGQTVPIYGARNNDRLPSYHRLDISCRYRLNKNTKKRFQHNLVLSVVNATGHRNIYAIKYNKLDQADYFPEFPVNRTGNNILSPSQVELARFFPSLTYSFKL